MLRASWVCSSAKAIYSESKAYLEVDARALVQHVVALLQRVPEVSEVWVVGNAERLESVFDPLNGVTTYGYDAASNLVALTDARNQTTAFGYDGFGQYPAWSRGRRRRRGRRRLKGRGRPSGSGPTD